MGDRSMASPASLERDGRKGRREIFLEKMAHVVPWARLQKLVEPFHSTAGNGHLPVDLQVMLRIYFLQQWFNLPDAGVQEALDESSALRRFAGIDLGPAPGEEAIGRFRRLLEQHHLSREMTATANRYLDAQGIPNEFRVKVGDGIFIYSSHYSGHIPPEIEKRLARVSAVRPKSFDAGGLCFRYDGKEWRGRSLARLASQEEAEDHFHARTEADKDIRRIQQEGEQEDLALAARLSYRDEREWLELGVEELRRIAALFGIAFANAETAVGSNLNADG